MPGGPVFERRRSHRAVDHRGYSGTHAGLSVPSLAREKGAVGDVIVTWPRVEAGWAGLTLDMKQNIKSVGKLSDFGDTEIVGVGHGEPIAEGGIEVLKKLREHKA